jgi:hypothetical protein
MRGGYKTSLITPLFIEMSVPIHICEQSCICVLWESILYLSAIFIFDFGIVPTEWSFPVCKYN